MHDKTKLAVTQTSPDHACPGHKSEFAQHSGKMKTVTFQGDERQVADLPGVQNHPTTF